MSRHRSLSTIRRHAFAAGALLLLLGAPLTAQAQGARAEDVLAAVVGVHAEVPPSARTAETLGTTRMGSGAVIAEDGLVVTIGYLILEAMSVELELGDGRRVPAEVVGYDGETGFGLLRASSDLKLTPLALGENAPLTVGDPVLVVSAPGGTSVQPARLVSRREFAGYWEYLLPDAIFTVPPHQMFGGAALIGRDGQLLGVGSLAVRDAAGEGTFSLGNMFVPIDALKPILPDLIATGRAKAAPKPWIGVNMEESEGRLVVRRVTDGGPAAAAGLREGDYILQVGGKAVRTLSEFYKAMWAQGDAGVEVPLQVGRGSGTDELRVQSADRYQWLRLDPTL